MPCPCSSKIQETQSKKSCTKRPVSVPILCLISGPGCDRDSLAQKMAESCEFTLITVGDLLRKEVKNNLSPNKAEIQSSMDHGEMVRMPIVMELLRSEFRRKIKPQKNTTLNGIIISGCPRNKLQAKLLQKRITPVDKILLLNTNPNKMLKKIKGRGGERPDDLEHTAIRNRITAFQEGVQGIIKEYGDKVVGVDANKKPEEIVNQVMGLIMAPQLGQMGGMMPPGQGEEEEGGK